MSKPRLVILPDLFGGKNPEWLHYYTTILESHFDIQYYNILELAGISPDHDETSIHNQFLNDGIENVINTLLVYEKKEIAVLGFSIGGTIAWKASLQGLKTTHLFAVSSTRLRYETEAPNCEIKLFFGDQDSNKPNSNWFLDLKIPSEILQYQNHQLYLEEKNAVVICCQVLSFKS